MTEKIKYSDLSAPLKVAVVLAWIVGLIEGLAILVGFIIGFMG